MPMIISGIRHILFERLLQAFSPGKEPIYVSPSFRLWNLQLQISFVNNFIYRVRMGIPK